MARKETVVNRITSFDESWDNNHTGQEVEDFITTKLMEADGEKITNMSYVDQQLILHKAKIERVFVATVMQSLNYYIDNMIEYCNENNIIIDNFERSQLKLIQKAIKNITIDYRSIEKKKIILFFFYIYK